MTPAITPQQATTWLEIINTVSIVAMLVAVIAGGYFKIWVWGYQLKEAQRSADEYKDLFYRSIGLYSQAVTGKLIVPRKDSES